MNGIRNHKYGVESAQILSFFWSVFGQFSRSVVNRKC